MRLHDLRLIDGELVISVDGTLSFEHLLAKMNSSSRCVMELARKQPAVFLILDILVAEAYFASTV